MVFGQPDSLDAVNSNNKCFNKFNIGFGTGFLMLYSDIPASSQFNSKIINPGLNFCLGNRINDLFSVSLNALTGNIYEFERPSGPGINFYTSVHLFDLRGIFHFDNDIILKKNFPFSPYISAGAGFLKFDPRGNLKDKNGDQYYYWDDSSIRNEEETGSNLHAGIITRDYDYETTLEYSFDDSVKYKRSSYYIPLSAGITMHVTNRIDASVSLTYVLTGTDFLDNLKKGSNNDKFLFPGISIHYKLFKEEEKAILPGSDKFGVNYTDLYSDVNFKMLDQSDYDGDGIIDIIDKCPQTPEGLKVYKNGCPLDDDSDGIPNYRDQEPNTPKGVNVNTEGKQTIDSIIFFEYLVYIDSLDEFLRETYKKQRNVTVELYNSKKIYKIQLLSYKYDETPDPVLLNKIRGLKEAQYEFMEDGKYYYTAGAFETRSEANTKRKELIKSGFKNAILVKWIPIK
ncbi:MAG: thrombospondin type 3 repeat-containing protein [Bacteroidota bacterium]